MTRPGEEKTRKKGSGPSLLLLCLLLFCEDLFPFPETPPLRTVGIRIAVDIEILSDSENKTDPELNNILCGVINDFSRKFERRFNLSFHIQEIKYWKPAAGFKCLEDFFNDLRSSVAPMGGEIILGVVAPKRVEGADSGISDYCSGHILIKHGYIQPNPGSFEFLIQHELCHMFGAVDLNEPGSIMDIRNPGFDIDDFTARVIFLNRLRPFQSRFFPLSDGQLDDAIRIYRERWVEHRDEPNVAAFLVNLLLERRDYEEAAVECRKALESNPLQIELLGLLGQAYRHTGEPDRAVNEFLKALTLKPMNAEENNDDSERTWGESIDNIEADKAFSLFPLGFYSMVIKGDIYHYQGNFQNAESEYQRLLNSPEKIANLWGWQRFGASK